MARINVLPLLVAGALVVALTGCNGDDDMSGFVCNPGAPATVTYDDQGTFQTPSLSLGGLTVTGSANVNLLNLNGIGIVGGQFDRDIDGTEWIRFDVDAGVAIDVSYLVQIAGNLDGDGLVGEATIEAFDRLGTSLGVLAVSGSGPKDVSAMFGDEPISAFVVTAAVDNHRIGNASYTACQ